MGRAKVSFRCEACGSPQAQWAGRCTACGEWNSIVEERPLAVVRPGGEARPSERPVRIGSVDEADGVPRPTLVPELDRVLGGGLVPGSVTLVGGEPGVGKSTLLLQALGALAATGAPALLVSAEESRQQVRLRAGRVGALHPSLWVVSETAMPAIVAALDEVAPAVAVIDSIQTVFDPDVGGVPGSLTQVRECAQRLVAEAKARGVAIVLVGHVTKDGDLAGPRLLEHLVDTVLRFEGERHHALRVLRAVKHRFGSAQEVGLFELGETGLSSVTDPAGLLLADRRAGASGAVIVPTIDGHRPIAVEVQALASKTKQTFPRRQAQGFDSGRLGMLAAVLSERAGIPLSDVDIWLSVVGGVRVSDPGADLGVALALATARSGRCVREGVVAVGEIGLTGEVRTVAHTPRRLAEAARLGFRTALVAPSAPDGPPDLHIVRVGTLGDAVTAAVSRVGATMPP